MNPILTWEGPGEVPNFCPQGCGGISEDPYGGPCKACWGEVDRKERARDDDDERCCWCRHGGELDSFGGLLFCGEECAEAYRAEWGDNDIDDDWQYRDDDEDPRCTNCEGDIWVECDDPLQCCDPRCDGEMHPDPACGGSGLYAHQVIF